MAGGKSAASCPAAYARFATWLIYAGHPLLQLDRSLFAHERAQLPIARHAFECAFAAVSEPVTRSGDNVAHRRGHQYLAGAGQRPHPCADVHGHARDVVAAHLDFTGMNAHSHFDAQNPYRIDDFVGTGQRGTWALERRDKPVAGSVDLTSPEALEL